jgi:hypothetical protein
MRRMLGIIVVGSALAGAADQAQAQAILGGPFTASYRVGDYFAAPGLYGTSYGFASYGVPRPYTTF